MDVNFLISTERSGSNLITKMLDAHPQICGPSPLHFIRVIGAELFKYGDIQQKDNWDHLLRDLLEMLGSDFASWKAEYRLSDLMSMGEPGDVPNLLRAVLKREAQANGKKSIFIKELFVYDFLPFLQWCFPDARYIYLVRDPRDMALSWRKSAPHSGGLVLGARNWIRDQSRTVPPFSVIEAAGKGTLVRYEDLVSDSATSLTTICDLIGVDYSKEMLNFHQNDLTRDNAEKTELWKNLSKEVMSDNFGKFKKSLKIHEIAVIEKICLPLMGYFGYKTVTSQEQRAVITDQMIQNLNIEERKKYRPAPITRVHDVVQNRLRRKATARF